jgi:predicted acyl esterase
MFHIRFPRWFSFFLFSCFFIQGALSAAPQTHLVAMRDGVKLATDVYVPEGEGPWSTIFLRFPYNKALGAGVGPEATKRGYVFVAQDTRGRFASEGENLPFDADGHAEGKWDGYDSAEWIAQQEWCNGKIGTWGGSAGAITQYLLAGTGQTNIVSQHLTVGNASLFKDVVYRGGIFRKALIEDWLKSTKFAPYALDRWTTNYPYTQYWKDREITEQFNNVNAVGIHIGGWFDIFAQATVDAFLGYQNEGGPGARGKQKLIMGPWTHGVLQEKAGELDFPGANTTPDNRHDSWKWFAATLQGEANGIDEAPAVTYYAMGASGEPGAPGNEWRTADRWPPLGAEPQKLYLGKDDVASFEAPSVSGKALYKSDPENPVPSVGGYELTIPAGPKDQRSIESRDDVLVFTSEPLETSLEVTGNVIARISLQSDAPDTDLIVRLCDVYPDGRSFNICEGALRLSLSRSLEKPFHYFPGDPVEVEIKLWPTSMIFNRSHRLRVHIASTSSPALEPNLQNGKPPRTGMPVVATNRIWFGPEHSSYLILPVFGPEKTE